MWIVNFVSLLFVCLVDSASLFLFYLLFELSTITRTNLLDHLICAVLNGTGCQCMHPCCFHVLDGSECFSARDRTGLGATNERSLLVVVLTPEQYNAGDVSSA